MFQYNAGGEVQKVFIIAFIHSFIDLILLYVFSAFLHPRLTIHDSRPLERNFFQRTGSLQRFIIMHKAKNKNI